MNSSRPLVTLAALMFAIGASLAAAFGGENALARAAQPSGQALLSSRVPPPSA